MFDYKAKTPLEAYQKAWQAIEINWDKSELARHLSAAALTNYDSGTFTFQVPTRHIADVFRRHSENAILRRTLEMYMPDGMTITVETVVASEVQP